jgi:hypothetical protein
MRAPLLLIALHPLDEFANGSAVFPFFRGKLIARGFCIGVYIERTTARGPDRVAGKRVGMRENDLPWLYSASVIGSV